MPWGAVLLLIGGLGGCANPVTGSAEEHLVAQARALVGRMPDTLDRVGLRSGDALLFRVDSTDGGTVTTWHVLLSVSHPTQGEWPEEDVEISLGNGSKGEERVRRLRSVLPTIDVAVFDADWTLVTDGTSQIIERVHEVGLFPYGLRALPDRLRREAGFLRTPRRSAPPGLASTPWGSFIFSALAEALFENDAIATLARRLSIAPRWLELPRFIGGSLDLYTGLQRPRIVPQPIRDLPAGEEAIRFRVSIWRFKTLVIGLDLITVPSVGPLTITGGLVSIQGHLADAPARSLSVTLAGVSLGPDTGAP
jgi:hypothetical protein